MTDYSPMLFAVTSLASFRITRLLTADTFPFEPLRDRLEQRWKGTIYEEGLTCPWCIGAWVSFALVTGLAQIVSIPLPGLYALAVSAIAGTFSRFTTDN